MTFTNDDLKRLKTLPLADVPLFFFQENKLGSLLSRLEAAEALLNLSEYAPAEEAEVLRKAWRQSCGEAEHE